MCTKNTFTISWSSFGALIGILTPINLGGCLSDYLVIRKTESDTLANTTDTEGTQDQLTDRQRSRLVLPHLSLKISSLNVVILVMVSIMVASKSIENMFVAVFVCYSIFVIVIPICSVFIMTQSEMRESRLTSEARRERNFQKMLETTSENRERIRRRRENEEQRGEHQEEIELVPIMD